MLTSGGRSKIVSGREAIVSYTVYLEGHGDLVSILITPISHIVTPIIPIINLLTKSP